MAKQSQKDVRVGQSTVRQSESRISADGFFEVRLGGSQRLLHGEPSGQVKTPPEICFIGSWVHYVSGTEAGLLAGSQLHANLLGDRLGHFPLQVENPAQWPFVVFAPQVPVVRAIEQLHGDANLIALANDRALQDAIHSQLASDLRQVLPGALVFR